MDDLSQWSISLLIGISIETILAWINSSSFDFNDGFDAKTNGITKTPLKKDNEDGVDNDWELDKHWRIKIYLITFAIKLKRNDLLKT